MSGGARGGQTVSLRLRRGRKKRRGKGEVGESSALNQSLDHTGVAAIRKRFVSKKGRSTEVGTFRQAREVKTEKRIPSAPCLGERDTTSCKKRPSSEDPKPLRARRANPRPGAGGRDKGTLPSHFWGRR